MPAFPSGVRTRQQLCTPRGLDLAIGDLERAELDATLAGPRDHREPVAEDLGTKHHAHVGVELDAWPAVFIVGDRAAFHLLEDLPTVEIARAELGDQIDGRFDLLAIVPRAAVDELEPLVIGA